MYINSGDKVKLNMNCLLNVYSLFRLARTLGHKLACRACKQSAINFYSNYHSNGMAMAMQMVDEVYLVVDQADFTHHLQ